MEYAPYIFLGLFALALGFLLAKLMDKSTIAIWQTKSSQFQSLYEESARREQKSKDDFITVNENLELT